MGDVVNFPSMRAHMNAQNARLMNPHSEPEMDWALECDCGEYLFQVTSEGAFCSSCDACYEVASMYEPEEEIEILIECGDCLAPEENPQDECRNDQTPDQPVG